MTYDKHVKAQKQKQKICIKRDFGGVIIADGNIKLNEMNNHCLNWIFASNNRIIHVIYKMFTEEIKIFTI